jgi:polygalacturonase
MSIGSETNGGVTKIRVTDLSLDGTDSGIRIKSNGSRGGLVHDVVYDDVCIRDSPNPISLDTGYTANGPVQGTSLPTFRDITIRNTRISGGGKLSFNGYDQNHRIATTLDNVQTTDDREYTCSLEHADITLGPGPVNLTFPAGTDSTLHVTPAKGSAASCQEKFMPFPASPGAPSAP